MTNGKNHMQNQHLNLAKKLKEEALAILENKNIWQTFTQYGTIQIAGSAATDLLVYPDLDVYFDFYETQPNVVDIFAEAIGNIVKFPILISIRIEKELYKINKYKLVPQGFYLQLKLQIN